MARKQSAPKKSVIAKTENPESVKGEILDKLPKRERGIIKGMIQGPYLPLMNSISTRQKCKKPL